MRRLAVLLPDYRCGFSALEAKLAKAGRLKQGMMRELLTRKIRLV